MKLPIIKVSELLALKHSNNIVLIDASNGSNSKANFETQHLDGALWVDVNTQLAEIEQDVSNGGRHPLPKIEHFAQTLGDFGISPNSHVVLYDDKNGANAAARLWWMLKAVGHEAVQVLDGGLQEAIVRDYPINSNKTEAQKTDIYPVTHWKFPTKSIEEIEKMVHSTGNLILDVRENKRYIGDFEPIDLVAGHIPTAINAPFTENLNENGLFHSSDILNQKYQQLLKDYNPKEVVVHCGSGITACHTLLAFAVAGMEIPSLYVGSWSEWSRKHETSF